MSDVILTVAEARKEKEMLARSIAELVSDFERRARGLKVDSMAIVRKEKSNRLGIKTFTLSVEVIVRLKAGSGLLGEE